MRKTVHHVCTRCQRRFAHSFTTTCPDCGALVDVYYDLEMARLRDYDDALQRYFDLLPIEDSSLLVSYGLGPTPLIHAERLGAELGLPWLYLKNECLLPTGTTKDRMAGVVLSFLRECGVRAFCTSSTGNSSTALANLIGRCPDMRMYLFSGEQFAHRVDYQPSENVVHFVLRDATFVEAFDYAAAFAQRHGLLSERGFFNPARREGLKLAYLEAVEQAPRTIDWYVQAVSSAMGVYGSYKGARELVSMGRLRRPPRLLCVQQETCSPMVSAFEECSPTIEPRHVVTRPTGIASAILRGNPMRVYPYVRAIVVESGGTFVAVSETEIREMHVMLAELEGLDVCFTSAAAVAGVAKLVQGGRLPREHTVMENLTGRERPPARDVADVHYLRREGERWVAEDAADPAAAVLD